MDTASLIFYLLATLLFSFFAYGDPVSVQFDVATLIYESIARHERMGK